jgi:hypothetical protein
MHPEIARVLVSQRHEALAQVSADIRRARNSGGRPGPGFILRRLPRWHITWTKTVLAPAAEAGTSGGRARGRGSSFVIIISAHR